MKKDLLPLLIGDVLDNETELTLAELCRACHVTAELVMELVDEGIVEPHGRSQVQWRFTGGSVRRVRCAVQLRQDLRVNWAGAALALELLEEVQSLRARMRRSGG